MIVIVFLFCLSFYLGLVPEEDMKRLKACFRIADKDHSGTLSFAEYVLFFSLLSMPEASLAISFKLFDLNEDGYISEEEFRKVFMSSAPHDKIGDAQAGILLRSFFKDNKKLSYKQFAELFKVAVRSLLLFFYFM